MKFLLEPKGKYPYHFVMFSKAFHSLEFYVIGDEYLEKSYLQLAEISIITIYHTLTLYLANVQNVSCKC